MLELKLEYQLFFSGIRAEVAMSKDLDLHWNISAELLDTFYSTIHDIFKDNLEKSEIFGDS